MPINLTNSVGNNLANQEDDVLKTKIALERLGFFDFAVEPVRHGYITRTLDNGIKSFQSANDLRVDGYLFPGGETESQINILRAQMSEENMPAVPPPPVKSEPLPAPKRPTIPGTNIPDRGVPEGGFPGSADKHIFDPHRKRPSTQDNNEIKPPETNSKMPVYNDDNLPLLPWRRDV